MQNIKKNIKFFTQEFDKDIFKNLKKLKMIIG